MGSLIPRWGGVSIAGAVTKDFVEKRYRDIAVVQIEKSTNVAQSTILFSHCVLLRARVRICAFRARP